MPANQMSGDDHANGHVTMTPLMLLSGIVGFGVPFFIFSQIQITSTEQTIFDLLQVTVQAPTGTAQQITQFLASGQMDHNHLIANTIGWSVQVALFLLSIPVAQALLMIHRAHGEQSTASLQRTAQHYVKWQSFCVRVLVGGDVLTDFYFVVKQHIAITFNGALPVIVGFDFGVLLVGLIYPIAICFVTVFCGRFAIVCVEAFLTKYVLRKG